MTGTRAKKLWYALLTVGLIVGVVESATVLSGEISKGISEGLLLAIKRVIPTALPFMIISDLFTAYARPEYIPFLPKLFRLVYSLPETCLGAVCVGSICGFPIGSKLASDMYNGGMIDKSDAERVMAYSSTPSPAFVIGVVGGGMLSDTRRGIILLVSIYLGVIASAQFSRRKDIKVNNSTVISRQSFNFVESVKSAGLASISVVAFISVFALLSNLIKFFLPRGPLSEVIIALLEVTGAAEFFAAGYVQLPVLQMCLIGFSLGFGGISVLCQSAAFAKRAELSVVPYIRIKLLSGIFTALFSVIFTLIFC